MTVMAGVFRRRTDGAIPDGLCAALEAALSRHPGEAIERHRDDGCLLLKADIGAFGKPARQVDVDAASFMVGEPLLQPHDGTLGSRNTDLDELHRSSIGELDRVLARARGVFALAHWRRDTGELAIATDKLGIRPVYYWVGEEYVVFASALRILEEVAGVPKVLDLRGVTEASAFGYSLGDRSPYEGIRLMRPAERITFAGTSITRASYWDWDNIAPSSLPTADLVTRVYESFMDAVRVRNGADTQTAAFLSGGLDSRVIVGALRGEGVQLSTFNFAPTGSQDQVFGAEFAAQAGVRHVEVPMQERMQPAWSQMMADAIERSSTKVDAQPERPRVVWSGDGGSVTLGHVYLTGAMVARARKGAPSALIELLNEHLGGEVPKRLLRADVVSRVREVSRRGLAEEISRVTSRDRGRALHLFLMYNDQHRHLTEHFESIDLHRLEFQLPFFDSAFVESVLAVPVDECLEHKFYMQWLRHFPETMVSVPWQAYPGHEPCPLPIPPELDYQWKASSAKSARAAQKRHLLDQADAILASPAFPHRILRRPYLRLARWLYRFNLRDLGYLIRTANVYHRYWRRSDAGRAVPGAAEANAN